MEIIKYSKEYYEKWNKFCLDDSVNGTFLQTKRFLNYHPQERFEDASILFIEKGNIVAVCPACCALDEKDKIYYSHQGSTYGGLVIHEKYYKTERLFELIDCFETYLREEQYTKVILKITPDILCTENSELLQFCLMKKKYMQEVYLNTYIDFEHYKNNVVGNFEQGRRTHVNNCIKKGLNTIAINEEEEIEEFYALLCDTLSKYNKLPVHTLDEMLLLKEILKDEIGFFGTYMDNRLVGGAMMFYFEKTKCAHSQYLTADPKLQKLSPMSFVYYSMIEQAKSAGYKYISWGISSNHDESINYGLTRAKEAYGSFHALNRIFVKTL